MDILAHIAEQRIAEAIERGELDNIPGAGRPLALEDDSFIPPHLRMAYTVLKNAGMLPPDLEDRRQISTILDLLEQCDDEKVACFQMQKLKLLMARINERRSRPLHIADEYYRQVLARIPVLSKNQKKVKSS